MLDVFENSEKWRSLHCQIYEKFLSIKIKLIEQASAEIKIMHKEHYYNDFPDSMFLSSNYSLCSCNARIMGALTGRFYYLRTKGLLYSFAPNDSEEDIIAGLIVTTADKIYFAQLLIFRNKLERAILILEAIVEQEGDISTSVIIWPKQLYESGLVDCNLCHELIKSSEDYVVFPANLYARYSLSITYRSLGQEENRINNQAELIVLRERYSRIREFAPMLKIMSAVS